MSDDWLGILTQDLSQYTNSPVNGYPYKLVGQPKNVYELDGKYYIETFVNGISNGIVHLHQNTYSKICEFGEVRNIKVIKFFDVDK